MKSAICKRMHIYINGELTIGPRDPLRGSIPATRGHPRKPGGD